MATTPTPVDPLKLAGIGAATELVGGGIQSAANIYLANKQQKFQERMANTVHEREMADLKRAGLNPILTGKYGGSPAPAGSMAQIENPARGATSAAVTAAMARNQLELQKSQIENQSSGTAVNLATANKIEAETESIQNETGIRAGRASLEFDNLISQIENLDTSSAHQRKQIEKINEELKRLRKEGNWADVLNRLIPHAHSTVDAVNKLAEEIKSVPDAVEYNLKKIKEDTRKFFWDSRKWEVQKKQMKSFYNRAKDKLRYKERDDYINKKNK